MPCSAPEHAIVALLKQCYLTPRCAVARNHRSLYAESVRARHSSQPSERSCYHSTAHLATATDRSRLSPRRLAPLKTNWPTRTFAEGLEVLAQPAELDTFTRQVRRSSGNATPDDEHRIAILGGGITGLATAHYAAREFPHSSITVFEASNRLGGWLQSEEVDVGDGKKVLFESGPRTLRASTPAAMAVMELIQDLGLEDEVIINPKGSIAASNRFVYYPDRLVRMPGPGQDVATVLWTLLTEPVFKGLYKAILEFSRDRRPASLRDESVASFLQRRLGSSDLADNLVSAVFHGIYAGDITKLSAASILPLLWAMEGLEGSLTQARLKFDAEQKSFSTEADFSLRKELFEKINTKLKDRLLGASVYSFKSGIGALTNALQGSLMSNEKVQFVTGDPITKILHAADQDKIKVSTTADFELPSYDMCISTLSSKKLCSLSDQSLPTLDLTPFVTVMVVNLYYSDPHILPEHGFGYLLPRSIPFLQNPERALGVVFDSDAIQGQDTAPGTKLTVMLGGHWWDGFEAYPDEAEGAEMAKSVLARHLKITAEPAKVRVSLQRDCIPQYTVGHNDRMAQVHEELKDGYKGRLRIAGNSYTGVGLNDCVVAARRVVMSMKGGKVEEKTGLEDAGKDVWMFLKHR